MNTPEIPTYIYAVDSAGLDQAFVDLKGSRIVALDVETARPRDARRLAAYDNIYNMMDDGSLAPFDPHTAEVRLLQLKGEKSTQPVVIDLWKLGSVDRLRVAQWLKHFKGVFIGHNIRFDAKQLKGSLDVWIDRTARIFDTMQASILLANSVGMGQVRGHSLADLARDFLDIDLDKTQQVSDWSVAELSDEQLAYAALDVCYLHDLREFFIDTLVNHLGQEIPLKREMEVLMPTARMEWNGLPFNVEVYKKVQEAARYTLPALLARIGKMFRKEIGQPPILATVEIAKNDGTSDWKSFYLPWCNGKVGKDFLMSRAGPNSMILKMLVQMGITDEEGKPLDSTRKALLAPLKELNPGVVLLLDYWDLAKQTQFEYDKYVHPLTGRIHSKYSPSGATTGRFSCSFPNLQQTPKLIMIHPDGTRLSYRHCFMADPGHLICGLDFAGQEIAVLTAMSGDPVLIKALNDGDDIHSITASAMFGIPMEKARDPIPGGKGTYRDRGKIVIFKQVFGGTAEGFAKDFQMELKAAKDMLKGFDNKYKRLCVWLTRNAALATAQNFGILTDGGMRFFGGSGDKGAEAAKARRGKNYGVQGEASVMTKLAMVEMDRRIIEEDLAFEMNGAVHDELLSVISHHEDCPTAKFYGDRDPEALEIQSRKKKAKAAKDKPLEEALETELETLKKQRQEECKTVCEGLPCAHRFATIAGECMTFAGNTLLKGIVPAGFSSAIAQVWDH